MSANTLSHCQKGFQHCNLNFSSFIVISSSLSLLMFLCFDVDVLTICRMKSWVLNKTYRLLLLYFVMYLLRIEIIFTLCFQISPGCQYWVTRTAKQDCTQSLCCLTIAQSAYSFPGVRCSSSSCAKQNLAKHTALFLIYCHCLVSFRLNIAERQGYLGKVNLTLSSCCAAQGGYNHLQEQLGRTPGVIKWEQQLFVNSHSALL